MLTQERLCEVLLYSPVTGNFTWRKSAQRAGSAHNSGYIRIRVDGKPYQAHRLAWLYMTGAWPEVELDHINHEKHDNCYENLREATKSQNRQNQEQEFEGAQLKENGKWAAKVQHEGKQMYLGRFDTKESAVAAYREAKAKLHTHWAGALQQAV